MEASLVTIVIPDGILSNFESFDQGLEVNRKEGHDFWKPGEVMQFRGFLDGVQVWVEMASGRLACEGEPMYRIAFGDHPSYPPQIRLAEAIELLRKELGGCDVH